MVFFNKIDEMKVYLNFITNGWSFVSENNIFVQFSRNIINLVYYCNNQISYIN